MPDAREALRGGNVRLAMDLLKADVRRAPRDVRLRTFLFQMFCITAEWDRALAQLETARTLAPDTLPMVSAYQVLIRCEVLREKVFRGERSPTVLGDPGAWLPLLIEATRRLGQGDAAGAATLRDAAFDAAPASPATLDGVAADWIADADPRLGPTLEAIVDGRYVWVAYERIRRIEAEPPADLRDQVWMPVTFTWSNEGTAAGFIPARYPGLTPNSDAALQLARRTEWVEEGEWAIPAGQRMLVTDAGETGLLDLRKLELGPADDAAG